MHSFTDRKKVDYGIIICMLGITLDVSLSRICRLQSYISRKCS